MLMLLMPRCALDVVGWAVFIVDVVDGCATVLVLSIGLNIQSTTLTLNHSLETDMIHCLSANQINLANLAAHSHPNLAPTSLATLNLSTSFKCA